MRHVPSGSGAADRESGLFDDRPKDRAQEQVVITNTSMLNLGKPVAVDVFTKDEALAFLAGRTGRDDAGGASFLADELGCLPLALVQAATIITRQALTYDKYLERLGSFPLAAYLKPGEDDPYPRGLAEAILLSLGAVTATDQTGLCHDLMGLIALLSPSGVSRDWLHTADAAGALSKPASHAAVDEALGELTGASLLSFSGEQDTAVTAHRLVMRVIRERHAHEGTLANLAARACKLLETIEYGYHKLDSPRFRDYVSQLTAMHDHLAPARRDGDPMTEKIRHRNLQIYGISRYSASDYMADGRYDDAILHYEYIHRFSAYTYGDGHLFDVLARRDLATAYLKAERPHDAISLFEQVLADFNRGLHRNLINHDREIVCICIGLAIAYRAAGRYEDSIAPLKQMLAYREHPTQLVGRMLREALVRSYSALGRHDEAIPLAEQTLLPVSRC